MQWEDSSEGGYWVEILEEGRDQTVQREGFWAERSVDFCRFQLLSRKSISILSTKKKKSLQYLEVDYTGTGI